jgi:hypothetical protein
MSFQATPGGNTKTYWLRPRRNWLASHGPPPTVTVDDSSISINRRPFSSLLASIRRPRRARSLSPALTPVREVDTKSTPAKQRISELAVESSSEAESYSDQDESRAPSPLVPTNLYRSELSASFITTVSTSILQPSAPAYSDVSLFGTTVSYSFSRPVTSLTPPERTVGTRASAVITKLAPQSIANCPSLPNRGETSSQHGDMAFSANFDCSQYRGPPANPGSVSDYLIAPNTFTGNTKEQTAEQFVAYFGRYVAFKQLNDRQKAELFSLLMRQNAQDWLSSLDDETVTDYRALLEAFKRQYFKSPNLMWKQAADVWQEIQKPSESVSDFITRVRRNTAQLNLSEQLVQYAIINGLIPRYKSFVLSHNPTSLEHTIELARLAETCTVADPVSNLVLDSVNAQSRLSQENAEAIRQLNEKLDQMSASWTAQLPQTASSSVASVDQSESFRPMRQRYRSPSYDDRPRYRSPSSDRERKYRSDSYDRREHRPPPRQTPQRRQKELYVRQQNDRQSHKDERRNPTPPRKQERTCNRCGYNAHSDSSKCPALNQNCNNCGKRNHFSRVCQSATNKKQ